MKLTNPVGRNVSLNADNDINPTACMCRNGIAFSSALGDSDNCSHCGIWSTRLVPDLDDNPICKTCVEHVGM